MPLGSIMFHGGGAIGHAVPCAFGAALGAPDRKIIALSGDGGTLYTNQALWSMARESVDVTVLVLKDNRYQILRNEVIGQGLAPNATTESLTDIGRPNIDHEQLGASLSVPSTTVRTLGALIAALEEIRTTRGPRQIQVELEP
jgi:acetolactate synthase-1/2/3 large subunit